MSIRTFQTEAADAETEIRSRSRDEERFQGIPQQLPRSISEFASFESGERVDKRIRQEDGKDGTNPA